MQALSRRFLLELSIHSSVVALSKKARLSSARLGFGTEALKKYFPGGAKVSAR